MKKTVLAAAAAMACLNLAADMISLFGSNVEVHARSAASVTGPQAVAIASALQPESTNGWIVAAHQNWLTNETDAAALAALGVHSNRTDNPHGVTAAQVGAPSVYALYALMATSRIDKVWEGTNAWWTFESNTITRSEVSAAFWFYRMTGAGTELANGDYYNSYVQEYGADVFTNSASSTMSIRKTMLGYFHVWESDSVGEVYTTGDDPTGEWNVANGLAPAPVCSLVDMVETNSVVYYLQTNLVPPETWSRTDMDSWTSTNQMTYAWVTNWMADGNAGQLWVTNLAFSSANVILNGHLNATEPHAGKYALQTGGTLTNATLSGNVTIGGVTRTSWPDGGGGTGSVIIDAVTNAYGYTSAYIVTNLTSGGAVSTNFFTDRALVPQTGQTNVYYAGYCDGYLRKGFPLPTPRFAALAESGAGTNQIRDLLTGLIWDRNAGRSAANLPAAYAVVSNMNAEVYGGANDWRLPNVKEAHSVLHLGYIWPAICNTAGTAKWSAGDPFNGVNSAISYSTSSPRNQNTNQLYAVGLAEGSIGLTTKQATLYLWPVRGP